MLLCEQLQQHLISHLWTLLLTWSLLEGQESWTWSAAGCTGQHKCAAAWAAAWHLQQLLLLTEDGLHSHDFPL
jgi:hypothetical protein